MPNHKILYEVRITFEDNTRVNFTGEGISELIPGDNGLIRLRHTQLITLIANLFKDYIKNA